MLMEAQITKHNDKLATTYLILEMKVLACFLGH